MNIAGAASVRGPGWVPGMALMESVMSNAASQLGVDPTELREINESSRDGGLDLDAQFITQVDKVTDGAQMDILRLIPRRWQ